MSDLHPGQGLPIQKRILKRYGINASDASGEKHGGRPSALEPYVPFTIDGMPRMAFRIFHYDRQGYLQRDAFYFHAVRGLSLREGKHGVLLSFYADSRVVTLRGGISMHTVAEAIEDCKLETIHVFHAQMWESAPEGVELIDRIAIDTLPPPGQERRRPNLPDDFFEDQHPLQ